MRSRDDRHAPRAGFLNDLLAQLFSDRAYIEAGRYCAYNGFLGLLLVLAALALRSSGSPDPLGVPGFVLVIAIAAVLLAAFVVPSRQPRLLPALLAVQGLAIVMLAVGFALACACWALAPATRSFRYLPGPIVLGTTYGAAQWADFGPVRARARRWRLAGFIAGIALELVVGVLVLRAVLRS